MSAVIPRVVERVARAREQHPFAVRVLGDDPGVGERAFREISGDLGPRLPEVRGLIEPRVAVVHQVKIDGDIGRAGVEVGRLDF